MALSQQAIDSAARLTKRLHDEIERVRNDEHLSATGKRIAIATAYARTTRDMRQLQQEQELTARLHQSMLEKSLFGNSGGPLSGSDSISVRDAQARADQLTNPSEALTLLTRSQQTGDLHLERAIANRAYDAATSDPVTGPAWLPTLERFAATRPGRRSSAAATHRR
jgi:hypothetical protein